jgi:Phytanoyl-CoA dioxygenase (PhyH)
MAKSPKASALIDNAHTEHRPQPTAFVRDGFAVLNQFLNGGEVEKIQTAVDSIINSPPDSACSRPHNTLLPFRWNNPIVQIVLASKKRVRLLKQAFGTDDLKWISGYVSIKEARSPALWWHQDWWCWDHPVSYRQASPQVALLCYLSATDTQNGALRVLAGTHHRSLPIHASLPQVDAHAPSRIEPDHIAMSDHPDQVTFSLNAGDAVAIDYRLLHGTHGNASSMRRDCIILNFTPSWQDLPDDIKGHLISHPALPAANEAPAALSWESELLPEFFGMRRDLPVNRAAPHEFQISRSLSS